MQADAREGVQNISPMYAALAHQADFDVCWCKGSVSERIFLPLVDKIKQAGAQIQGSSFVTGVDVNSATGEVELNLQAPFSHPSLACTSWKS